MTPLEIYEMKPAEFYETIKNADSVTIEKLLLFAYGLIHYKLIEK